MALSEEFLEELSVESNFSDYNLTFENMKVKFLDCLQEISIERKGIFDIADCKIYMQGSFPNNVFTNLDTKLEVVIEIKKTVDNNFEVLEYENLPIYKKRFIKFNPNYSLSNLKEDLFQKFLDKFSSQEVIKSNRAIQIVKNSRHPLTVDVLPAYTFKKISEVSFKEVPALFIFETVTNNYTLAYPHLHSQYIEEKDIDTTGNFRKIVRGFRRFRDVLVENEYIPFGLAPGYFIDCLLSNVPNELLCGTLSEIWVKVLNFLKFSNLNLFLCVHKQFSMFQSGYDGWSISEATLFINALIDGYYNIKE